MSRRLNQTLSWNGMELGSPWGIRTDIALHISLVQMSKLRVLASRVHSIWYRVFLTCWERKYRTITQASVSSVDR
jgi:hypothetical protein